MNFINEDWLKFHEKNTEPTKRKMYVLEYFFDTNRADRDLEEKDFDKIFKIIRRKKKWHI